MVNQKSRNENSSEKTDEKSEDFDLSIPTIPEAPKKNKITVDSPGLSTDLVKKMKELESKDNKVVLVNCERCKEIIPIAIPIKLVKTSKLPVVPISYVHKNSHKKDQHCLTLHIDHDFDIRRQRISDVIFSNDQ
ncbi:MAG: hypothetical protein ACFE9R_18360 [Candidatus Hermodarchaeota archaeon]